MLIIRKAESRDVAALFRLINGYAREGLMLPRTLGELGRAAGDFAVAEDAERIVGCGALRVYSGSFAEIRSLSVEPGVLRRGIGRAITEFLIEEAARAGVKSVFALTLSPAFFEKCGFREASPSEFPARIRRSRFERNRNPHPDKRTMVIALTTAAPTLAVRESAPATA